MCPVTAKRYSQTGWRHSSRQPASPPAPSSESVDWTTERLSYRHTAPLPFVLQALANPIRTIRQSGKIDGRSQVTATMTLSFSWAVSWSTLFHRGDHERKTSPCKHSLMWFKKTAVIPKCKGFLFYFLKADNNKAQVNEAETDRKLHVWHC